MVSIGTVRNATSAYRSRWTADTAACSSHTIASSCCANCKAGPTIVRIGTPLVTPLPSTESRTAIEVSLSLGWDAAMTTSGLTDVGKVNVEVVGWRVHAR
jgi:hypothetical protein